MTRTVVTHGSEAGPLTPERWQRVTELLGAALELEPGERTRFVRDACPDDELVRREALALLADDATGIGIGWTGTTGGPERGEDPRGRSGDPRDPRDRSPAGSYVGRRFGPYRVEAVIAEGGMGIVLRAVREDDFEHRVALKLIHPAALSDETLRRFHAERQILARLDHPHVARIFDGGTTDDGIPYFAMEHLDGRPIDRYCDEEGLSIEERLTLFRQVCSAVHVAHQSLVVHRDLKPGNVLVTADGTPKLLDFGIAKPLGSDQTLATAPGVGPMTLRYASPEQIRGEAITTASDVYALGVLLFKLLTGAYPYPVDSANLGEIARIICEVEPERPSAVVGRSEAGEVRRRRRRLAGDLDDVVKKTLRKEPRRRYRSAEQLADDLGRHLEGRPVLARPSTWRYRAGKFARRHALALAATTVLVLTIVVSGAVAAWLWQRAAAERDRARLERARAESVSKFLEELLSASHPNRARGAELTAREILARGKEKILGEPEGEPEQRADLVGIIGRVYRDLGLYPEARPLLEEEVRLRRAILGERHPKMAESLSSLAILHRQMGDSQSAKRLVEEAISIQREHHAGDRLDLAITISNLARMDYDDGEFDRAERGFRDALEMKRRLGVAEIELVKTRNNLASVLALRGDYRPAEEIYREVLDLRRRHHGTDHTDVATSLIALGTVLRDRGALDEAEPRVREALAVRRRLLDAAHPAVARGRNVLGTILQARGELEAAAGEYRAALAVQREKLGGGHPDVATTLGHLATLFEDRGDFGACEETAREALAVLRELKRPGSWRIAHGESVLGGCLLGQGRYDEARPLLLEGYRRLLDVRGDHAPQTGAARERVEALRRAAGPAAEVRRR